MMVGLEWNEHAAEQEQDDCLPADEGLRERVAGQRIQHQIADHGQDGDRNAVQQVAGEGMKYQTST